MNLQNSLLLSNIRSATFTRYFKTCDSHCKNNTIPKYFSMISSVRLHKRDLCY